MSHIALLYTTLSRVQHFNILAEGSRRHRRLINLGLLMQIQHFLFVIASALTCIADQFPLDRVGQMLAVDVLLVVFVDEHVIASLHVGARSVRYIPIVG